MVRTGEAKYYIAPTLTKNAWNCVSSVLLILEQLEYDVSNISITSSPTSIFNQLEEDSSVFTLGQCNNHG